MILQMREMGHIPGAWGSKVGIGSNTSQAWWDSLQTGSDSFFYVLLRYRFQWWLQGIVSAYRKKGLHWSKHGLCSISAKRLTFSDCAYFLNVFRRSSLWFAKLATNVQLGRNQAEPSFLKEADIQYLGLMNEELVLVAKDQTTNATTPSDMFPITPAIVKATLQGQIPTERRVWMVWPLALFQDSLLCIISFLCFLRKFWHSGAPSNLVSIENSAGAHRSALSGPPSDFRRVSFFFLRWGVVWLDHHREVKPVFSGKWFGRSTGAKGIQSEVQRSCWTQPRFWKKWLGEWTTAIEWLTAPSWIPVMPSVVWTITWLSQSERGIWAGKACFWSSSRNILKKVIYSISKVISSKGG